MKTERITVDAAVNQALADYRMLNSALGVTKPEVLAALTQTVATYRQAASADFDTLTEELVLTRAYTAHLHRCAGDFFAAPDNKVLRSVLETVLSEYTS